MKTRTETDTMGAIEVIKIMTNKCKTKTAQ